MTEIYPAEGDLYDLSTHKPSKTASQPPPTSAKKQNVQAAFLDAATVRPGALPVGNDFDTDSDDSSDEESLKVEATVRDSTFFQATLHPSACAPRSKSPTRSSKMHEVQQPLYDLGTVRPGSQQTELPMIVTNDSEFLSVRPKLQVQKKAEVLMNTIKPEPLSVLPVTSNPILLQNVAQKESPTQRRVGPHSEDPLSDSIRDIGRKFLTSLLLFPANSVSNTLNINSVLV